MISDLFERTNNMSFIALTNNCSRAKLLNPLALFQPVNTFTITIYCMWCFSNINMCKWLKKEKTKQKWYGISRSELSDEAFRHLEKMLHFSTRFAMRNIFGTFSSWQHCTALLFINDITLIIYVLRGYAWESYIDIQNCDLILL